ncbi:hypothetical protein G7054_g7999 [Neopestalotiopsis clavispora]|nr:hypothetical protein G7054_g7999 [Neopestalotiopsis clavispora]
MQSGPNISQQYEVGPDISEQLFDNILNEEVLRAWKLKENSWPLYIVGGPGSGKSTLVSTVAQKLKDCDSSRPNAVVTLFVREQMQWNDDAKSFILLNILHQLAEQSTTLTNVDGVTRQSQSVTRDANLDSEASHVHAIKKHLQKFNGAFLIFDGIDRCGFVPGQDDDNIWKHFQDLGFKVMMTSRSLACDDEEFYDKTSCDACNREPLGVYWRCESGKHQTVDDDCADNDDADNDDDDDCEKEASDCGNDLDYEDDLDEEIPHAIHAQTHRHGRSCRRHALQLRGPGTRDRARKPGPRQQRHGPPAPIAIRRGPAQLAALASGALAPEPHCRSGRSQRRPGALRVDIVHENMEVIQEAEALPGGLPHALTVLFDAEIQGILAQSSQIDAVLGIKTLAIWAAGADTEQYLLGQLEEVGGVDESACTIERVLHATRGLLMIAKLEARPVLPYSYTFATYVRGGYCSVVDDMRAELGLVKSNEVVDMIEVDEVD